MENKVCAITTIKASLKDTLDFVNYHLNIGICHMYVFFDDPKDGAADALKDYKGVTCFRCDSQHWKKMTSDTYLASVFNKMKKRKGFIGARSSYLVDAANSGKLAHIEKQELNAKYSFKLAKKNGYDWIIHLDGDELIYVNGNLHSLLSKISKDVDVLRLIALEGVPEECSPKNMFREVTLFKSMAKVSRFYYAHKKLLQKVVPLVKRNEGNISGIYFKSHVAGKSIVRTNLDLEQVGIHEPVPKKGEKLSYAFSINMCLLHFDCCAFDQWYAKWLRRYKGSFIAIAMKKKGIETFEQFVRVYRRKDKNGLYNLYKKQYFMSSLKKNVLLRLGLLRRIRLDGALFEKNCGMR